MKNEMENFRHAPQLKIDVGPVSRRQPCGDVKLYCWCFRETNFTFEV